jgi:fatty-acid peroxygenase
VGGPAASAVLRHDLDAAAPRWPELHECSPERFIDRPVDVYELVPQRGGEPVHGHRCPGELATDRIIEVCVRVVADLEYDVAPEDRRFSMRRMPARHASGPPLPVDQATPAVTERI